MKKNLLLFLLICFGLGLYSETSASSRKRTTNLDVNVVRTKSPTKTRSGFVPIMVTISPDGNNITLRSVVDMGTAYIVISGDNGMFYADQIDFNNHPTTIDTSEFEAGRYTITIEFENGATYTGVFQFIEE